MIKFIIGARAKLRFSRYLLKSNEKLILFTCIAGEGSDGVELVSIQQASPEEIEQARKLQLPDNFYLYRQRPKCPGCRGCEEHEEAVETKPFILAQPSIAPAFAGLVTNVFFFSQKNAHISIKITFKSS